MRRPCHEVSPETKPEPVVSTNEAPQNSLHRSLNFLNVSRGTSHTEQNYRDPEQSPAGASTTTEPLADDIVAHNRQLVTNYADALYDARAEDILAWADEHVPGDIAVTMSMENTVLAELASRYVPRAGAATTIDDNRSEPGALCPTRRGRHQSTCLGVNSRQGERQNLGRNLE